MKKTFKKHYVRRDPGTLQFVAQDGEPVIGEFIREARITQDMADELNLNWRNSGHIWVLAEKPKKKEEPKEKVDEKSILWEKVDVLVESGELEKKPHPKTGIKKLKEILGEE